MKLLLTGSGGLLGTAITAAAAARGIDCVALARDGLLESSMAALVTRMQGFAIIFCSPSAWFKPLHWQAPR